MFFGLFKKKWPTDELGYRIPRESLFKPNDGVALDNDYRFGSMWIVSYVGKFTTEVVIHGPNGRKLIVQEDRLTLVGRL